MATLNERIERLERTIRALESKIRDLSSNTEEKTIFPYSEVDNVHKLENFDAVFVNGKWRFYAIYKDDE